jgi:ABC-2 type transport system permease protein
MSADRRFSFARLWAMVVKEFIQLRRDRMTFAMIFGIPIMQIFLFGFVIDSDPRHMPAAIHLADDGPYGRALMAGLQNSTYYNFTHTIHSEEEGRRLLARGEVQFVVSIPPEFTRDLLRGDRPVLLVEADASDPTATGGGLNALAGVVNASMQEELKGPLARLAPKPAPVEIRVHALHNPEAITSYNIVPGLMGVVLTLTLVMITALAITRERERGTMENLLAMPLRPAEVLIGKITLYIFIGYLQIAIILAAARYVFDVPVQGNLWTLLLGSLLFIAANLSMGITFSTIATNQLQAMQMAMFIFLPSMLLSGFMFPFRGMPHWAQWLGEVLPITHFLRITRGVMLKGTGIADLGHEFWPIAAFAVVMMFIGIKRYRQTLD